MSELQIAGLPRARVREAGAALARAFDEDPVSLHLYPHPRRRRVALRGFFGAAMRDALGFGEVWAAFDGTTLVGVAAWLPESAFPTSRVRELKQIVGAAPSLLTPSTVVAGLRFLAYLQRVHPRGPHWYLGVVGVEPKHQSRGIGGRLLTPVLERLDAQAVPAYLETSTEANVAWYSRKHFEVRAELHPFEGGPRMWAMWRDSRPTS